MFEAGRYKRMAKAQLKGRKTVAVIATLITILIYGSIEYSYSRISGSSIQDAIRQIQETTSEIGQTITYIPENEYEWHFNKTWEPDTKNQSVQLLLQVLQISIEGILLIALCHLFNLYYISLAPVSFDQYLKGFNYWLKGVLGMWWYTLWVTLWTFVFIIPGFVKSFAYSQMFFIIAENPKISVTKAMNISKVMTNGFKGDLFVLVLSFIGWEILSIFTLGLLQLWLIPYQMMTFTNAYKDMKAYAIKTGKLTLEDFN